MPIERRFHSLLFFVQNGLPWIWKWDLITTFNMYNVPIAQRTFWYRWWNKFSDLEETVQQIKKTIDQYQQPRLSIGSTSSSNPFDLIKDQLRSQFPHISDQELVIKSMELMKNSFLQSFSHPKDDASITSAQSTHSDDNNAFHCLVGESQDPNEEASVEDFWNSLTHVMATKYVKQATKYVKQMYLSIYSHQSMTANKQFCLDLLWQLAIQDYCESFLTIQLFSSSFQLLLQDLM